MNQELASQVEVFVIGARDSKEQTLERHGDRLLVRFSIVDRELDLRHWQFANQGRGTAKQILTRVEEMIFAKIMKRARVSSVVNLRFSDHIANRGWTRVDPKDGSAPDYLFEHDTQSSELTPLESPVC